MSKRQAIYAAVLVCLTLRCLGQDMIELPDQTPMIPAPSGWAYESAPGAFFWGGFGASFSVGLVAWVVGAIKRRLMGGFSEE